MRYPRKGVIQIAEIANGIMDPLLSKRAGINTALLGSWDEIAGDDFADCTRPEKITWPRRDEGPDRGGYQPGVLTIACEGARALFLTHAQGELIARINGFLAFRRYARSGSCRSRYRSPFPAGESRRRCAVMRQNVSTI